MDPITKKVWGVMFIVLGVLLVMEGASEYSDTLYLKKSLTALDRISTQMANKSDTSLSGLDKFVKSGQQASYELINHLQIRNILAILLGICCSICGTFLLKKPAGPKQGIQVIS